MLRSCNSQFWVFNRYVLSFKRFDKILLKFIVPSTEVFAESLPEVTLNEVDLALNAFLLFNFAFLETARPRNV